MTKMSAMSLIFMSLVTFSINCALSSVCNVQLFTMSLIFWLYDNFPNSEFPGILGVWDILTAIKAVVFVMLVMSLVPFIYLIFVMLVITFIMVMYYVINACSACEVFVDDDICDVWYLCPNIGDTIVFVRRTCSCPFLSRFNIYDLYPATR
jgi:predicted RNA-binding Zn-ribbon protein involved in translation (DUF1610 family)